jgi:hypothetical protein
MVAVIATCPHELTKARHCRDLKNRVIAAKARAWE